jgi:hypothetical protein
LTLAALVVDTNVSEKHTASSFKIQEDYNLNLQTLYFL